MTSHLISMPPCCRLSKLECCDTWPDTSSWPDERWPRPLGVETRKLWFSGDARRRSREDRLHVMDGRLLKSASSFETKMWIHHCFKADKALNEACFAVFLVSWIHSRHSLVVGPGHFHTDCTLWGRLVFGKIQERLGLELGLGVREYKGSKFPLAVFWILRFIGCA